MTNAPPSRIGAIILAAGASRRMGQPKLLLTYKGVPLLRCAVDAAVGAGCDEVIVVLGADADRYAPLLASAPVHVAENPGYAEGLSSSIRVGVEALSENIQAAVLMLADQPFIDAAVVRRLVEVYRSSGKRIVACQYGTVHGVPTLFDRALFLELLLLEGDQGARQVIKTYPKHVATVEIPLQAASDVDTPTDAKQLLSG